MQLNVFRPQHIQMMHVMIAKMDGKNNISPWPIISMLLTCAQVPDSVDLVEEIFFNFATNIDMKNNIVPPYCQYNHKDPV